MASKANKTNKPQTIGPRGKVLKLHLNNHENSKKSFARVLRLYATGELEDSFYRNLVYGFSKYLEYEKFEFETRIEEQVQEIQAAIDKLEKRKR